MENKCFDNNDGHFCEDDNFGNMSKIKSDMIIKIIYLTKTLDNLNNAIGKHLIKLGNPHVCLYIKGGQQNA